MTESAPSPGGRFKPNKWWLIGGGVAVALVYYEYKKARSVAPTATDTGVDNSGIDPATGVSYAEEDAAGYTGASSAVTGSPYGSLGGLSYNAATGQWQLANSPTTGTTGGSSTNSSWAQAATNYLVGEGFDTQATINAIGAYLNGAQLTQAQLNIVQAALGYQGTPPVGVPTPTLATNTGQTSQAQAAAPSASTLTSLPSSITGFIRQNDKTKPLYGLIAAVLPDGSLLGLTNSQYTAYVKAHPTAPSLIQNVNGVDGLQIYNTAGNITSNPIAKAPVQTAAKS